ncbi:MAG: hypothetical protein WCG10_00310 [Chlamydiota bacterium]
MGEEFFSAHNSPTTTRYSTPVPFLFEEDDQIAEVLDENIDTQVDIIIQEDLLTIDDMDGSISTIEKLLKVTSEISKGVLSGVIPHVINMSPWYLSKMINMRSLTTLISTVSVLSAFVGRPETNFLNKIALITQLIIVLDLFNLAPLDLNYRVAIDIYYFATTVIGSSSAIYEGIHQLLSSWNDKEASLTTKVSNVISGTILTSCGAIGIKNIYQRSWRWINGVSFFKTLDLVQQRGVLTHKAIHTLGGEKSCKAVVFIGPNIPVTFPFSELLYEHCDTKTYEVYDRSEFYAALREAKVSFGSPVDVLAFEGHANNKLQSLGKFMEFEAYDDDICHMNEVLSSNAQIFLLGCNTATPDPSGKPHLTKLTSNRLPNKEVNGVGALYNPLFSTSSYSEGRFFHNSYFDGSASGVTETTTHSEGSSNKLVCSPSDSLEE